MHIGFEAKRATHNSRGLGNYSRGLIEGLLEYSPKDELYLFTPPFKERWAQNWVKSLSSKAHIKLPKSFVGKKFPSFWRSFLLPRDLREMKLDIFHGLSHEIPYRLDSLPFKKIVTIHDLIFLRYPEFFPLIDRLVYAQKFQYACTHSDTIIAICEQTKADLIKFFGVDEKKIVVHYQSCSPIFYNKQSSEKLKSLNEKYKIKKPFILNVGAFEERKNQLNILEAYAQIANQIEDDLVFIGQGKKYKSKVQARALELKLNSRVYFLDKIDFSELPLFYQAANVFCFPSLFEGFGIPIIEALFSGTPVITSFGSCFPESAGADSYFVDPLSQSDIGQALLKVAKDQNLRNHMSLQGLKYVQRFHRQQSTSELLEIYRRVII